MKIAFISCWRNMTIYAIQASHVRASLESKIHEKITIITSNCGCFYDNITSALVSPFKYKSLLTNRADTFMMLPHFRSKEGSTGNSLRTLYRSISEPLRGYLYARAVSNHDIAHFHQSGDAFGYIALKHFLKYAKFHRKVITIYSLSLQQRQDLLLNHIYNAADAVIVSTNYAKDILSESGVELQKIHVIPYGTTIKPIENKPRKGLIMFAGSPLIDIKGFQYLAPALRILKEENITLPLKLHGFFMPGHREWAFGIAEKEKVRDLIEWLSLSSEDELMDAYQNSLACVVPYTDYTGCFPITVAMASAVPVVGSDSMGIPEYLNEGAGLVVKSRSAEELASALKRIVNEDELRTKLGNQGRLIAEKRFSWDNIAEQTLAVYRRVLGK